MHFQNYIHKDYFTHIYGMDYSLKHRYQKNLFTFTVLHVDGEEISNLGETELFSIKLKAVQHKHTSCKVFIIYVLLYYYYYY
jgi:hypothetical protein